MAKRRTTYRRKRKTTPPEPIVIDDSFKGLTKLAWQRIRETNGKQQPPKRRRRKRSRTSRHRRKKSISIFDISLKKVIAELFLFWLAYKAISYYFF